MTLSERERRELAALEQRFAREEPRWARRMQSRRREPPWMAAVFALLMLATIGGGLALIVLGVTQYSILLMGLGIGLTAGGPGVASVWLRTHHQRT